MKIISQKYLFIVLILFRYCSAPGQEYYDKFENLSVEQGLSQSTVRCILQDSQGFMWFGTEDGLNRFDGYNFTVYKPQPHDPNTLSHISVWSLCEDHNGVLWVGTQRGFNKYLRHQQKFNRYLHNPDDPHSISHNVITSICEDQSGGLWIGTWGGGLNRFSEEDGRFVHYVNDPHNENSLSHNIVLKVYKDSFGDLWIGTQYGLNRLNRGSNTFTTYFSIPDDPESLSNNSIITIFEDSRKILWFGTWSGGLNEYNREKDVFHRHQHKPGDRNSICDNEIWSICEDINNELWIATEGGVSKYNRNTGRFINYRSDSHERYSLSGDRTRAVFSDRSGNVWIGTQGSGLNKIDRKQKKFIHIKNIPDNLSSLSNNTVYAIYESHNGFVWVGTDNGLNKLITHSKLHTAPDSVFITPDPDHDQYIFERFNIVENNRIRAISDDHNGSLWLGTAGGGVFTLDAESAEMNTGTFINYKAGDNGKDVRYNYINTIYICKSGRVLIGSHAGLLQFDPRSNTLIPYETISGEPHSAVSTLIWTIFEDRAGALWIGTGGRGLIKIDRKINKIITYENNPDNQNSLSHDIVKTIFEDKDGFLWIGTKGGGLNKFDPNTEKFKHYTEKDGLPNNVVYGILEDDDGFLWISTNNGLSKFNPKTESFRNFDSKDGLQSNEFNGGAYWKCPVSGLIFFGGVNGLNVFHPSRIRENQFIPPVVITDLKILHSPDAELIMQSFRSEANEITLSHNNNAFSFDFAALDYSCPAKNQYAYKMAGVNKDWLYSGTRRFVTYSHLKPGSYLFRVKGSNNDGIWNETGSSIKITIVPPWWQSTWAYALYIFIFGAIVVGLWRFQMHSIKLKNELKMKQFETDKLSEIDHLKSRFFANISHEFRTPLTLILGPLEQFLQGKLKGDVKDTFKISYRYAKRLQRLINQLLDISKLEAGRMALHVREENIIPFLKGIVFSFASLAERKNIGLEFYSSQDSILIFFDRDKIDKIMTNLLSNALKFTKENGTITVTAGITEKNMAEITVADSGIGISAHHLPKIFDRFYQVGATNLAKGEGTGIGLALTRELVELHHGEITVASRENEGTTFRIYLPQGKDHFQPDEIIEKLSESLITDPVMTFSESDIDDSDVVETVANRPEAAPIILLVEDNQDVRNYIREYLKEQYRIAEAGDGVEGLRLAIELIPDIIISDVMMPNMDGFEFCNKIKTDERTSHVPVILLTAKASLKSRVDGLETGADDYLTKPFNVQELQIRIRNLIEQRKKLRERFSREVTLQPSEIAITSTDEKFLLRVIEVIEQHIAEPEFDTHVLARESGFSRSQLNRKLRALTDQSPREFIRIIRLKRAAQLIAQKAGNVTEIAYDVGFNSISHFAKRFKEFYGVLPSEYGSDKI